MRRRQFITLLGGAAISWPLTSRAQQPAMPVIDFIRSTTLDDSTSLVNAFRQGLKHEGFVEGRNVVVEYHAAEGKPDRLQALVAQSIRRPATVIVANGPAAMAAKAATKTIPIVFAYGGDPIKTGLVASLNRPEGNVTGAVFLIGALGAKRLTLLHQLAPKAAIIGVLVNESDSESRAERSDVQAAAQAIGQQVIVSDVNSGRDIESAFGTFVSHGVGALHVSSGVFMLANRKQIITLAARHGLPASYPLRDFVMDGGLMSYGTSITDTYRQVGSYTGRILKGEKPGELPIMQSSKFELVVNLKVAKALGLVVPGGILSIADELID